MVTVNNNQDLTASSGISFGSTFDSLYHSMIDNAMAEIGENITLHLPPGRTACTDSQCSYDPFQGRATRYCPTCRGTGFIVTTRDTIYKAQITVGPRELDDNNPAGRLEVNECRITTVIESYEDLRKTERFTVRGEKYQLKSGPKIVGFNTPRYIISILERVNEGGSR